MAVDDLTISLPAPVAVDGRLDYRREEQRPFLIAVREGRREPYLLDRQRAVTVHIGGRGPFVFYGDLPPEAEGHMVSFYSMNREMCGRRYCVQTLKDFDTNETYRGGFDIAP